MAIKVWVEQQSILPNEYQGVEYIESSGEQYIDTWINRSVLALPIIEYKFNISALFNDTWLLWYWVNSWYIFGMSQWQFRFVANSSSWWGSSWIWFSTWDHIFTTSSTSWFLDWVQWTWNSWNMEIRSGAWNLLLFQAWWFWQHWWITKVYYCNMSNTSWTLVRRFLPCYRKSDNVIWMYDVVGKQFYTNAGTGEFYKWPNKEWEE